MMIFAGGPIGLEEKGGYFPFQKLFESFEVRYHISYLLNHSKNPLCALDLTIMIRIQYILIARGFWGELASMACDTSFPRSRTVFHAIEVLFLQHQLFAIDLPAKSSAFWDMPLCSTTCHFNPFSFVFQPPAEMCRKEKGHGERFQGASIWHEKFGHCHKSLALRCVLWVGYMYLLQVL